MKKNKVEDHEEDAEGSRQEGFEEEELNDDAPEFVRLLQENPKP